MDSTQAELFVEGVKHGLEYFSHGETYYGGRSFSDVHIETLEKSAPSIRIAGIKEEPIDLYIRDLIKELQSKMLSSKFKQYGIKKALEQFSEVKFKDKYWWGTISNSEIESLIAKVKTVYSGQTLMLSEGLKEAYLFGKLHKMLTESENLASARKTLTAYKQTEIDRAALKHIDDTANLFWEKAIAREIDPISIRLLQGNRDATTGLLKKHFQTPQQGWRSTVSDIYNKVGKNHTVTLRDIDRITLTELSSAQNNGILHSLLERGKTTYFVIVRPTACKLCKSMYLDPNGTPKKFSISEHLLLSRDVNWGARVGDEVVPQPPPRHPHCFCRVSS